MYIPERHSIILKQYFKYLSISTIIVLFFTFQYRSFTKPPFPHVPDIPAHIPFTRTATWDPETNHTVFSKKGIVASDSERCSNMGISILRKGGNAADAAVITCLCIGATDTMFSSGIGGGAYITSKNHQEESAISIDAREMAPGNAYPDMFKGREHKSKYGGLASGIPGELMGLWKLFEIHGSGNIKWEELLLPVAELMEQGWEVSPLFAFALQTQRPAFNYFRKDWDFVFKGKNSNQLLEAGDIIKRPAFAQTLRYLAKHGALKFYDSKGYIARSISETIQEWEGLITPEDFDKYNVIIEDAITLKNFTNDNLTIFSPNGSSSGLSLISGLSIINEMHLNEEIQSDINATGAHRIVEVMKWMASTRSYLGDIGIYNTNDTQINERKERYSKFLTKGFIDDVVSKINDNTTHPWESYNPAFEPNDPHGTSSLSVVDEFGNAVVITTTVNLLFGSCVHDPITGIIMNNEMDDFSLPHTKNAFGLEPSIFNYIQPYKRPLSSSAQSIIVDSDGNIQLVIGAAGGSRITNAIFQGIVRTFMEGKDLTNVIANPRIHHQLLPDKLFIEEPIYHHVIKGLEDKGHDVEISKPQSAMNAIRVLSDGTMVGQSDWWRKFGVAVAL